MTDLERLKEIDRIQRQNKVSLEFNLTDNEIKQLIKEHEKEFILREEDLRKAYEHTQDELNMRYGL